jgi:hypothetical protein
MSAVYQRAAKPFVPKENFFTGYGGSMPVF